MKVYLTGGAGFVGGTFLKLALERYQAQVFAALNRTRLIPSAGLTMATVELTDADEVRVSVRAARPDAIVHMAFFNDIPLAYERRVEAWRVMVDATRHLTAAARELNIPIILVSTDWVFDGTQAPARETTPPNPINYYGVLKVVGETVVTDYPKGAVARVAGVFGPHWWQPEWTTRQDPGFGNLPVATIRALEERGDFALWTKGGNINLRATPTLASDACEMIYKIIQRGATGVFHCCGGEGVGRLELARRSAEAFGLDPSRIRETPIDPSQAERWSKVPIPEDSRLDAAETARTLGHELLSVDESLARLKTQLETGRIV